LYVFARLNGDPLLKATVQNTNRGSSPFWGQCVSFTNMKATPTVRCVKRIMFRLLIGRDVIYAGRRLNC